MTVEAAVPLSFLEAISFPRFLVCLRLHGLELVNLAIARPSLSRVPVLHRRAPDLRLVILRESSLH